MSIGNALAGKAKIGGGDPAEAKKKLLEGLNPEQTEVVLHDKGPLLVVAVAGAGKTHALVNRCGYLTAVRGANPNRLLAVTFSRKGADEMQERLDSLIGDSGARVGTFHSLAYEILRREIPAYADEWKVDDRNKYRICIKDAVGYKEMDWKTADVTVLESFISLCKCNLARPDSDVAAEIAQEFYSRAPNAATQPSKLLEAYSRADDLCRQRKLLTFDNMLMEAVELLRDDDDTRIRWANKYDYVLQDEAQDQNLGQLLMGELLAQDHKNYMLVGDPAQTIFTWRGAKPEKLLNFEQNWGAKVIKMARNYRCGQVIINAANKSLAAMDPATKLDIAMMCERGTEGVVRSTEYENLDEEGAGIANHIAEMVADGKEPRDFAILYRTNAQSRAPEEALIGARIPYRIIGGACFYERREVKNLLAYLRLASGKGELDDIARCINTPFRFLGRAFLERVREAAKESKIHKGKGGSWARLVMDVAQEAGIQRRQRYSAEDWGKLIEEIEFRVKRGKGAQPDTDTYKAALPARILEDVVRQTRYQEWLQKDEGEESTENSRVSNVREIIRAAARFTTVEELLDYVDKTVSASKDQRKEKDPNKVTLCSLHRAKGLEWPTVFLAGCASGILPHARAEDPEEERRLFYVGVTRARDTLHLSCVRTLVIGHQVRIATPSEFLVEAGLPPEPYGGGADADEIVVASPA